GLTAKSATFGRREVIEGLCDALPAGGRIEDILEMADEVLASEFVVQLGRPDDVALRTQNGRPLPSGRASERFSTPEMVQIEQQLMASAARRLDDEAGIVRPTDIAVATGARPTISDEQRRMVDYLCSSGCGVDIVEGVAGSGKTYALAATN